MVWGTAVWAVRDGPAGPRVRLYAVFRSDYLLTATATDALPQLWSFVRTRQGGPRMVQRSTPSRYAHRPVVDLAGFISVDVSLGPAALRSVPKRQR